MKFLTIGLLAIATLFNISAYAACPGANVTLTTQAEIDNFATTYPGCEDLTVNLKIKGAGITNLDGLSGLKTITGNLLIEYSNDLVDITGLSGITSISGEMQFEENHGLTNLDGLQNLTTLGKLELQGMDALTDISQLSGLTTIADDLKINDCDALTNLNGLQNITSVGADLIIKQSHNLTDLTALSNLTTVGNDVAISSNKNLVSLDGLNNINSIGGDLDVVNNPSLADCLGVCRILDILVPPGQMATFTGNFSMECNDVPTLEAACLIFLPVELTDFRAKEDVKYQNVAISWATASELNNKHFEVERSADGRNFEGIGIVAGNGTTTKANYYYFVDAKPITTAYYRLKQVDFSGEFIYSDIVLVKMTKAEDAEVTAYPTIANGEITVRFTGFKALKGTFNVFNAQGSLVHAEEVDLSNKMAYKTLNTSKLHTGIYTIVISDNSNHISTNFIVVK